MAARLALVGGALATLVGLLAAPADAHLGAGPVYNGRAGPYAVYAYDGVPGDAPGTLAYAVNLLVAATGEPVDDSHVTVTATSTDGGRQVGPVGVESLANLYQYVLPDPSPARWRIALHIDGPAGPATAHYTVHGLRPNGTAIGTTSGSGREVDWHEIAAFTTVGVAAVGGWVVSRRSRRTSTSGTNG